MTEKQGLMSAVSLRIQTKIRKRGLHVGVCRVRALIRAPLPHVWEFLIKPEHMHLWGPLTQPVTGIDQPLQAGDRVTQYRKDSFGTTARRCSWKRLFPSAHCTCVTSLLELSGLTPQLPSASKRPRIEKLPGLRKRSSLPWARAGRCDGLIAL